MAQLVHIDHEKLESLKKRLMPLHNQCKKYFSRINSTYFQTPTEEQKQSVLDFINGKEDLSMTTSFRVQTFTGIGNHVCFSVDFLKNKIILDDQATQQMRNTLGDTRTTNDDNTTQLDDTDFQYSNEIRNCRKIDNSNGETTSSNNDRPNSLLDNMSEEDKESFTNDDPDSLVENMTPNDKDSSNNNDSKSSNENESDNDSDSEQSDVSVHSDESYNSKDSDYNSLDSEEE